MIWQVRTCQGPRMLHSESQDRVRRQGGGKLTLVPVQSARQFWVRRGFRPCRGGTYEKNIWKSSPGWGELKRSVVHACQDSWMLGFCNGMKHIQACSDNQSHGLLWHFYTFFRPQEDGGSNRGQECQHILHTHTCAPDFWPKGYKTLSKFVKYNDVKGTLPSLHYPLLQSCGRAPRNLTWQSATTFCSDVTPIEKMIFDCHVGFRGSYIYIPRAHTHFLTHRSNPQTWRRYDGARANVLHYDAAKNRSMVFRKTLKQKPPWLEMTWRCGEIGEMISR